MKKKLLLWFILFLPYVGLYSVWHYYNKQIQKIENSSFLVVSKENMTLSIYNYKGKKLHDYPIAIGKNKGNKNEVGDLKTPEGVFTVSDIQNSINWSHDFGDGNGIIKGAYGPYFIRLLTPGHSGIGIHGTHDNESLGHRATEGCIRLQNENIEELVKLVHAGTVVIITPAAEDLTEDKL